MADPVIRLDSDRVTVEPGGQAQVGVTVINPGSIVEGYQLDVVGEGVSSWAEVTPAELSVYPQAEAKAFVTFHPPGGNAAPSGTSPFGVRVRSTVDSDASAVAEGDVEVGKVFGLQAKIIPVTSTGRWRGRHTVQLSNWGNAPARLRLTASDPDQALGFYVQPDVVELPLGGSAIVRVSVRTRKPFLRGNPVRLPFQVVAEQADAAPQATPTPSYSDPSRPVLDAALNQKPILTRALVTMLSLILVAGLGLGAYAVVQDRQTKRNLAEGIPEKPVIDVEVKGPDAVVVSWEQIAGVKGYRLYSVDPRRTEIALEQREIPAGQTGQPIEGLRPATQYCYQLSAVGNSDKEGAKSDRKCVSTAEGPPPTPTPTPTVTAPPGGSPTNGASPATGGPPPDGQSPAQPSPPATQPTGPTGETSPPPTSPTVTVPPGTDPFAGGKWIATAFFAPIADPAAQPAVNDRVAKLKAAQLPAQSLNSAQYPTMTGNVVLRSQSLLAAVGPYNTRAEAEAVCPQILAATGEGLCYYFQPKP